MERRELLFGGLATGATMLLAGELFGDDKSIRSSGRDDGKSLVGKEVLGHKVDSFGTEAIVTTARNNRDLTILTVDFGSVPRGFHIREFNVPVGTTLVLGQVQEGINAGNATYQTLGIAVRAENTGDWRARVIWQMSWNVGDALPTYGRFILL